MANKRFYQFLYSKHAMLTMISGEVVIGSSGAVSSFTGKGVTAVTKLTTGIYSIQFDDAYNAFLHLHVMKLSGVTGADVSDGSLSVNTPYQITAVGTTNWANVGLPSTLTPAVGQFFVASASGGSGSGKAKAITTTGVSSVEVCQNAQTELNPSSAGAIVMLQLLDTAGALVSPTSGAKIEFQAFFRNSSVAY